MATAPVEHDHPKVKIRQAIPLCTIIDGMRIVTPSRAPVLIAVLGIALILPVQIVQAAVDPSDDIAKIANDYLALNRTNTPTDTLPTRSPATLATLHESQDRLLGRLRAVDPSTLTGTAATAYAILMENMESLYAVRVCRTELWDLNHRTMQHRLTVPAPPANHIGCGRNDRSKFLGQPETRANVLRRSTPMCSTPVFCLLMQRVT